MLISLIQKSLNGIHMARLKFLKLESCLQNCIKKIRFVDTDIIAKHGKMDIRDGFIFIIRGVKFMKIGIETVDKLIDDTQKGIEDN